MPWFEQKEPNTYPYPEAMVSTTNEAKLWILGCVLGGNEMAIGSEIAIKDMVVVLLLIFPGMFAILKFLLVIDNPFHNPLFLLLEHNIKSTFLSFCCF